MHRDDCIWTTGGDLNPAASSYQVSLSTSLPRGCSVAPLMQVDDQSTPWMTNKPWLQYDGRREQVQEYDGGVLGLANKSAAKKPNTFASGRVAKLHGLSVKSFLGKVRGKQNEVKTERND